MRTKLASRDVIGHVPTPFEDVQAIGKNGKHDGSLIGEYIKLMIEVAKLKQTYLSKANHADDLEEE